MAYLITFRALSGEHWAGDEKIRKLKPEELTLVAKHAVCNDLFAKNFGRGKMLPLVGVVTGGKMSFEYKDKRLWTITVYDSTRKLTAEELILLETFTRKQWLDGIGYLFAQYPCVKLGKNQLEEVYLYPGADKQEILVEQKQTRAKPGPKPI